MPVTTDVALTVYLIYEDVSPVLLTNVWFRKVFCMSTSAWIGIAQCHNGTIWDQTPYPMFLVKS